MVTIGPNSSLKAKSSVTRGKFRSGISSAPDLEPVQEDEEQQELSKVLSLSLSLSPIYIVLPIVCFFFKKKKKKKKKNRFPH